MQQPFQTPDEQAAERSALEVFPGAAEALESNQWWLEQDQAPTEADQGVDVNVPETVDQPEPSPFPSLDVAPEGRAPAPDPGPSESPAPRTIHDLVRPSPVSDLASNLASEPASEPAPAAHEEPPQIPVAMPPLAGRDRRTAAGASQRAAILAAAGASLNPEEEADLARLNQRGRSASAPDSPTGQPKQPKQQANGRRLTRKIALSLFVSALSIIMLSGGAYVSGQGAEVERLASSLAPEVLERWITDRFSSFGDDASPVADHSAPALDASLAADAPLASSLSGQIARPGGVAVRSTCVVEARSPRRIPTGTPVTVIAQGVGDCSGWSVVRAGAAVSWVETSHLGPVPTS